MVSRVRPVTQTGIAYPCMEKPREPLSVPVLAVLSPVTLTAGPVAAFRYFVGSDAAHPLLLEGPSNLFQDVSGRVAGGGPVGSAEEAVAAAGELRRNGVSVVLVADRPDVDDTPVLGWAAQVTGSPAERVDDVWVFRMR
jgi:hypothetical protein